MSDLLNPERRVKARKQHRCDWCNKKIAIGESHICSTYAAGGHVYSWRECDRCASYVKPMMQYVDSFGARDEGYFGGDMIDFMRDEFPEVLKEWEVEDA